MKKLFLVLLLLAIAIKFFGQNVVWAKKIPAGFTSITQMKMDNFGNFYLRGTIDAAGSLVPAIAQFDPQLQLNWLKTFQSTDSAGAQCNSIEMDHSGNIYAVGSFVDSIKVNSQWYDSPGQRNGFVIGFNTAGNTIYSRILGGMGTNNVGDIDFDPAGNMYITGDFIGNLSIDSESDSLAFQTTFIAKFVNNTLTLFKYSHGYYGGGNNSTGKHIKVNANQNIFIHITGYGNIVFDSLDVYDGCPYGCEYIAEFDSQGNALFLNIVVCQNEVDAIGMLSGNRFLTCESYQWTNGEYAEVNSYTQNGSATLVNNFSNASNGASIAVDNQDNNFLTGYYYNANPPPANDTMKLYISKNDTGSVPLWKMYIRASQQSSGVDIVFHSDGYLYVLGAFQGMLLTPDSLTSASLSTSDYFIAKVADTQQPNSIQQVFAKEFFELYPNPSPGEFLLQMNEAEDATICVYNMSGKCILTKSINNMKNVKLDLRDFSKGMYFVEVNTVNSKSRKKIMLND